MTHAKAVFHQEDLRCALLATTWLTLVPFRLEHVYVQMALSLVRALLTAFNVTLHV